MKILLIQTGKNSSRSSRFISAADDGKETTPLPWEDDQTNVNTVSIGAQLGSPQATSFMSIIKPSWSGSGMIDKLQLFKSSNAFFFAPFWALSLATLFGLNIINTTLWLLYSLQIKLNQNIFFIDTNRETRACQRYLKLHIVKLIMLYHHNRDHMMVIKRDLENTSMYLYTNFDQPKPKIHCYSSTPTANFFESKVERENMREKYEREIWERSMREKNWKGLIDIDILKSSIPLVD